MTNDFTPVWIPSAERKEKTVFITKQRALLTFAACDFERDEESLLLLRLGLRGLALVNDGGGELGGGDPILTKGETGLFPGELKIEFGPSTVSTASPLLIFWRSWKRVGPVSSLLSQRKKSSSTFNFRTGFSAMLVRGGLNYHVIFSIQDMLWPMLSAFSWLPGSTQI